MDLNKSKASKQHGGIRNVVLVQQFRAGSEWSPGKPIRNAGYNKVKHLQPNEQIQQKISDVLISHFLHESPRADKVSVVPNSLQLVDPVNNVWRAKVQTTLFFPVIEPRIHESLVRFRVVCIKDKTNNPAKDVYSIFRNHIIFPS